MSRPAAVIGGAVAAVVMLPFIVIVMFLGTSAPGTAATGPAASVATQAVANTGAIAGGGSATANEALGARLAAAFGWTGTQDTCLNELWTRESGWRADAKNPQSGAYGISQALGHAEGATIAMNVEGDNYPNAFKAANPPPWGTSDAATQISWGLGYIQGAYGTPCGAWAHETADGFY